MKGLIRFEHRRQPLVSTRRFAFRMVRAGLVWCGLTAFGLLVGMAGYAVTEGMGPADAFLNAAMILSGMGPVQELHSTAGKIFAGLYAIFSGLGLVIAAGFVLGPVLHRMLHAFHVEEGNGRDD